MNDDTMPNTSACSCGCHGPAAGNEPANDQPGGSGNEPGQPQPGNEPGRPGNGDQPGDQPGEGEGQGEGDQPGESDGGGANGGAGSDGETGLDGGEANGAGTGVTNAPDIAKALQDAASKALDNITNDVDIAGEASSAVNAVVKGGGHVQILRDSRFDTFAPSDEARLAERRAVREFNTLRADAEEGWDRARPQGRLNVGRYISSNGDLDVAFDQWRDRKGDASDLEVVLLLDDSMSMASYRVVSAEAMWVLKRGLDAIGANTTVVMFHSESRVLYKPTDKAEAGRLRCSTESGGTDPSEGIAQAARIFAGSRKGQKVLITITDGDYWGESVPANCDYNIDDIVKAMTNSGVVTAQVLFNHASEQTHGHAISTQVSQVEEIASFAKELVKAAIKSRQR